VRNGDLHTILPHSYLLMKQTLGALTELDRLLKPAAKPCSNTTVTAAVTMPTYTLCIPTLFLEA